MIWNILVKTKKNDAISVAKRTVKQNKETLHSLREYDQGKKDIPTAHTRAYLSDLHSTS